MQPIASCRIESGTFLVAAAATGGSIVLRATISSCLCWKSLLKPAHASVAIVGIHLDMTGRQISERTYCAVSSIPTDMQAQFMALNVLQENGGAMVVETIFENRFMHVQELSPFGCKDRREGDTCLR